MSKPAPIAAPETSNRLRSAAIILIAAFIAVTPLLLRGPSCGDDFDFHLASWMDAQRSWLHGIPYPHWANGPNFGAGEPRFVFYPPITWMLGAGLGLILPWQFVPVALTFLLLAATGFASRALAREILPDAAATIAGFSAIFFGYALYTAYERTAYGELSGGFWLPLILLYLLRPSPAKPATPYSLFPVPFLIAGAWLSNAPVGVMACYTLACVALAAALVGKSWTPIIRAAISTPLGLGLTAFFVLPAAYEQRWVDIQQATTTAGLQIEDNWLFRHHADPSWWWHDHELQYASLIVVAMLITAIVGALLAYLRGTLTASARRFWLPLALIAPVVLVLQFPVSAPLWNLLPKLRFLQFPWRWMLVLEAPMALFFAAAIWSFRPRLRTTAIAASGVFFLLATAAASHSFYLHCDSTHSVAGVLATFTSGKGFSGTAEYSPPGATTTLVPANLASACLVTDPALDLNQHPCDQSISAASVSGKNGAEQFDLSMITAHPGYLILRLRSYQAWTISVNSQSVTPAPMRKDGLLTVPVPQGPVHLTANWTATPDVFAGRIISAVTLLLLIALIVVARRWTPVRLSS